MSDADTGAGVGDGAGGDSGASDRDTQKRTRVHVPRVRARAGGGGGAGAGKEPTWERLRLARERRGHDQGEAARQIGVSQSSVSEWERLLSVPGWRYWRALASYCDCPTRDIGGDVADLFLPACIPGVDESSD